MSEFVIADTIARGLNGLLRYTGNAGASVIDAVKGPSSLTRQIKGSVITSRAFVDDTLSSDSAVLKNVLTSSHLLYCAIVLNAYQLSQYTVNGRTIKDSLSGISSEDKKIFIPMTDRVKLALEANDNTNKKTGEVTEAKLLPYGKIIDLYLSIPVQNKTTGESAGSQNISLSVIVRINPYYVGKYGMEAILGEKSNVGVYKRYIQWRVGEIRFWKDFIFNLDVLRNSRKALMNDKSGGYKEYNDTVIEKTGKFSERLYKLFSGNKAVNSNIANSIFVVSKDTITNIQLDYGIDILKPLSLQRFFNLSYSMLLYVVDTTHEIVSLYANGWDYNKPAEFSYRDLDMFKSKGDSDFMEVLKKFSSVMN